MERKSSWLYMYISIIALSYLLATWYTGYQPFLIISEWEPFWNFLTNDFFPPQLSLNETIVESLLTTLGLALSATFCASLFAGIAAIFGSESISPSRYMARTIRGIATFLRNIPTLVWAFILFSSLGVGTGVGFMALFITSFAFLTRAFIEIIDEISQDSLDTLLAVGASFWPRMIQGVLPNCIQGFVSWYLYCLEVNVRSSTIVGMVGGGGIGMVLFSYLKAFKYPQAAGIIILIAVFILLMDFLTSFIRKRVAL